MVSWIDFDKAISTSDLKTVKKLIDEGADLNSIYDDITPLGLAARAGEIDIVRLLINEVKF